MSNKLYVLLLLGFISLLTSGCSTKWTEAIRNGTVAQNEFDEIVSMEINEGLIFLPVTIQERPYRFLFDSGAPFSISKKLQDEFDFHIISKGNIIDSDHNRTQVKWIQVDSMNIGDVSFLGQTAFVGNFETNPVLKCLEIDGIIGSNIIRQCNWTIDPEQKSLSLCNTIDQKAIKERVTIPFKTDFQYNIFIDLNFGSTTVKNILMDFGSNGSIYLNNEIFSTLKERDIFRKAMIEIGIQQSGIIGKSINLNREIAFTDSINLEGFIVNNVKLKTGKTVSVGNEFLSRFRITIDWDHKKIHLEEIEKIVKPNQSPGFKLGFSADKGVFVQSVIQNSNAYNIGVRPLMKVLKIDHLDFEKDDEFCDYLDHELRNKIFLKLINSDGQSLEYHFEKTKY